MVRQVHIETESTATSIVPSSTANSDYDSTVIIAQSNKPEPISSELINLDIHTTLQKAMNLANNQEEAITPQAAPKKVIEVIMAEANQLKKAKELKLPQESSEDIYKASKKAYNNSSQHKEYQILADLWKKFINSYLTVRKFLGHPNTCKLLNGWKLLMEKKNMMLLTAEWRKKASTTQASAKNNPSGQKQQLKHEKAATSSEKGQRKSISHKTLQPGLENRKDSAGGHGKYISDGQNNDGISKRRKTD
ncbi:hypothetical protein O181_056109 [Austropuccinia psidii MF-1]|uniref:Uncharacterized protein n=1 Tax=Austropuccinia psidii MF-1 TaxID=1389203 RepID=A0A9Q3E7Y5_9BASI|nr:hypothetical protein [Austropuccinia psidii MF-1]